MLRIAIEWAAVIDSFWGVQCPLLNRYSRTYRRYMSRPRYER